MKDNNKFILEGLDMKTIKWVTYLEFSNHHEINFRYLPK